jgi:malonyl-CoA O-methyltransferase
LDLGSGTGYVVEELLKIYPKSEYTLLDISSQMLEISRKKLQNIPRISYIQKDMDSYKPCSTVDLIISNFAMQWSYDIKKLIADYLERSNVLAFSTLTAGTFAAWRNLCSKFGISLEYLDKYPNPQKLLDYCRSFKTLGSSFHMKTFPISFESPIKFLTYLNRLGANIRKKDSSNLRALLQIIRDEPKDLHTCYEVLFVVLINKNYLDRFQNKQIELT